MGGVSDLARAVGAWPRRRLVVALGTALSVLCAGLVTVVVRAGDEDQRIRVATADEPATTSTTPPDTTTTTATPDTTSTTPAPSTTPVVGPPATAAPATIPPTTTPPVPFGSVGAVDRTGIYLVNADGSGNLRRVFDRIGYRGPVWSPDGTRLAFTVADGPDVVVLRVSDGASTVVGQSDSVTPPSWSPDGTQLAWASGHNVLIAPADGSAPPHVLVTPEQETGVAWSRAGRLAALGFDGLWVFDADGGNRVELSRPDEGLNYGPVLWSPDSSRLIALPDALVTDVVVNADGTNRRDLAGDDGRVDEACWAPDGRRVVWKGVEDGVVKLFVGAADGSRGTAVATDLVEPAWSPVADVIAATRVGERHTEIVTLAADGSALTPVIGMEKGNVAAPAWSPDGKVLAFKALGPFP